MKHLIEKVSIGNINLESRMVMAPLTRNRAPGAMPNDLMKRYYAQRANPATGVGLIISEGTAISNEAQGYADVPGIWSQAQLEAWKPIVHEVHKLGGKFVSQLWHVGRVSHVDLQIQGAQPVAPSAIAADTRTVLLENGVAKFVKVSEPRALRLDEIPRLLDDYVVASRNAIKSGFDGVEIHCANGYLLHQFLSDTANKRDDQYGGTIENRARLCLEVIRAIVSEVGAHKTAIRLSPTTKACGISDTTPLQMYLYLLKELANYPLLYIHVIEGDTGGARDNQYAHAEQIDYAHLKKHYLACGGTSAWMVNNGYDKATAEVVIINDADLVSFGKLCIANPDLRKRFELNASFNSLDVKNLYGGGEKGYTDYPFLS
ncbi:MAG: alkene reductase [Methylacidiphilales bacterium]|nr:alkene reductase [Candidatus Methylacidiphilales bacterium]